ncbi:hypothetical protein ENUP19_0338G0002 [Entamoeba nuttalli]|uniref:SH3 domain-containing protein n=1 Tax=Entamoeba nuttalli TaxID=412467 RepID=A0ABQ0DX12_9EUKA
MSEKVGTKFNRKMFQLKTHLGVKEKTHDSDLKTAKERVIQNKKLYKQILHCAEILPTQAFTPIDTLKQTAIMVNDSRIVDILNSIEKTGFEEIEQDLIYPLRQHIEYYDDLQRRIDDCHKTRIDMDRHKEKLESLMKKTGKEGKIKEYQIKFDAEKERYSKLRSDIINETECLEEERMTIARPIMSSLLVCYTKYLNSVSKGWKQIEETMKEIPPNFQFSEEQHKIIPVIGAKSEQYKKVQSLYYFEPNEENELLLNEGDIIKVYKEDGEWWYGENNGKTGYFPSNYVRII